MRVELRAGNRAQRRPAPAKCDCRQFPRRGRGHHKRPDLQKSLHIACLELRTPADRCRGPTRHRRFRGGIAARPRYHSMGARVDSARGHRPSLYHCQHSLAHRQALATVLPFRRPQTHEGMAGGNEPRPRLRLAQRPRAATRVLHRRSTAEISCRTQNRAHRGGDCLACSR